MGILRDWFGPSRNEIWQQFAAAIGGNFTPTGFLQSGKVEAKHGEWTVRLNTCQNSARGRGYSGSVLTEMRAPYVNPDGFRFNIYRKGMLSDLGKRLGMQDVVVGFPQFDEDFIIQGSNEAKLRQLLADEKLRSLIQAQPDVQFSVRDQDDTFWDLEFPPDVDELFFCVHGEIMNVGQLRQLYDLFAETLDELCRMGSAYAKDPKLGVHPPIFLDDGD